MEGHQRRAGSRDERVFAIDIDGVLCDVDTMLNELAVRHTGQPWPQEFAATPTSRTELIPDDVLMKIFDEFHGSCLPQLMLLPGAPEALRALHDRYRLVLVTARRATSESLTREWLARHGLVYDALYHLEDKTEVPEPVVAAIDDHPRHILRYLARGVRCFVMDYPRNRDLEAHPLLTRVSSWSDVLDRLLQ